MNATQTASHSHRKTSASRRRTQSPDHTKSFRPTELGKQTSHSYTFGTPSPKKVLLAPKRSVPEKRKQQISPTHSTKRGRLEFGGPHTPSKQVQFFTSPRCHPSPHHKPRASSPLRASAVSPLVIIRRSERRTPLGPLTIELQSHGGPNTGSPSKPFQLYESPNPEKHHVSLSRSRPLSPTRPSNNKENVPPFSKVSAHDDPFLRPRPRGPLTKLKHLDQEDSSEILELVETETHLRIEETITSEYFAGAKIVTDAKVKEIVVNEVIRKAESDDIQIPSIPSGESNLDFEIYNDEPEDLDRTDYNSNVHNIMMEEEEDKENEDPGVNTAMEGMECEEERRPRHSTRKHQEDWS